MSPARALRPAGIAVLAVDLAAVLLAGGLVVSRELRVPAEHGPRVVDAQCIDGTTVQSLTTGTPGELLAYDTRKAC